MVTKRPFGRTAALCLSLLAISFQPNLRAENGRNFAGSYQLQNLHSDGDAVSFDLYLRLVNYSGADLTEAKISLTSRFLQAGSPALDYTGEFNHVSVKYRKYVSLHGSFTVPESEYQQWQKGATPDMIVTYTNDSGDQIQNNVELSKVR